MKLLQDNLEVTASMVSGAIVNWTLTLLIFDVSPQFATATTALFFVASYTRSIIIRRIFRKMEEDNATN